MPEPSIRTQLEAICENLVAQIRHDGLVEVPDCRLIGDSPVARIDTLHTHVTLSVDVEGNAIEADFKYEDPTLGDVRGVVFDATVGGEGRVAEVIADLLA